MTSGRLKDLLSHMRQSDATRDATRDKGVSDAVASPGKNDPRCDTRATSFSAEYFKCINDILGRDTDLSRVASPRACDTRQTHPTPLSPAAEAGRQKVLALLARDGKQYAVYVEDPSTDPVIMALATPEGTCEVLIPKDRYDPFAVLAIVKGWDGDEVEVTDFSPPAYPFVNEGQRGSNEVDEVRAGEGLDDIATGALPLGTVQAFEQAAIAREAEDLREFFEERAVILEFDAGLPRPDAELEAARITATLARNRGYLWASLRVALTGYPVLLAQVPQKPAPWMPYPLACPSSPCSRTSVWCGRGRSAGSRR